MALLAVETMSRRLDTRGLAVIAAIAAVDSALRLALVSGIGGFSPIFLLILCAGYAMGAEFGFRLRRRHAARLGARHRGSRVRGCPTR